MQLQWVETLLWAAQAHWAPGIFLLVLFWPQGVCLFRYRGRTLGTLGTGCPNGCSATYAVCVRLERREGVIVVRGWVCVSQH